MGLGKTARVLFGRPITPMPRRPANLGNIAVVFGYPAVAAVASLINLDATDVYFGATADSNPDTVTVGYDSDATGTFVVATDADCYVTYTEAASVGALPTVAIDSSAC